MVHLNEKKIVASLKQFSRKILEFSSTKRSSHCVTNEIPSKIIEINPSEVRYLLTKSIKIEKLNR